MGSTPQSPPTPPNSSGSPTASPGVRQQYQPPQGAISITRLKRVAVTFGLLVLGYFTIWGSCHRQPATVEKKKPTAQVWPMSPANIDSQQAELDREIEEAKRAAEQAELAKRRAQSTFDADGPHTAEADPVSQLRQQLRLEDVRRAHSAAYASTIAFAPQGGHAETKADSVSPAPVAPPLQKGEEFSPSTKAAENQSAPAPNGDPPPGAYRLDEGTIIETVLLNRLDGEFSGPVITQVANDVYSRAGLELLIPRGSRLLGEAREVNGFDERRLAILFHRVILPNGKAVSLDKFRGLDQIGETGLVSKVDHHYLEIFGTSLALGGIGGLAQIGAYGGYGYNPATGFRIGVTERMGSSAEQVLAKFLNKYPTIKVLEGTRIKVILTNDLNLEAYQ
jgi:type IV secretory pathway VirB10-like protein